jgi:hypothetical protein
MSSIAGPFKIYPNLDLRFENIPSGNPVFTNNATKEKSKMSGILKMFEYDK